MKKNAEKAISEAKEDFLKKKWLAIEKGRNTDCVFVLEDDSETQPQCKQKFHGLKWSLVTASETFDRMFNGALAPVDNVVFINGVKPKIFKCLLQYVHLAEIFEEIDCQEAVELAQAADMYLMEPLKKHCIALIESSMTVEKVWGLLSQLLQVNLPDLAAACYQLLSAETLACLEHRTFLSASEECVIALLKLDKLNVASEMQLIKHCKLWAKENSNDSNDTKEVMRRLQPHLRLLTLSSAEAAELSGFLTCKEKLALMTYLSVDRSKAKRLRVSVPPTICPLSTARIQLYKDLVLDLYRCKGPAFSQDIEGMSSTCKSRTNFRIISNTIRITAKVDIHVTSLEGFCRIEDVPKVKFNEETGGYDDVPKIRNYVGQVNSKMIPGSTDQATSSRLCFGDFTYNGNWSGKLCKPYTILKGETKEIVVSKKAGDGEGCIYRKVEEAEANAHIKKSLRSSEAGKHLEQVSFCGTSTNKNPIFVKSFSYVVKN